MSDPRVSRAAMKHADMLAKREIARHKPNYSETQHYWNEMCARTRVALKQAMRDAGIKPTDRHIGTQLVLPWED